MTAEEVTFDCLALIDEAPLDFIWEGATYQGVSGAFIFTNTLDEGGFITDFDLIVSTTIMIADYTSTLSNRFPGGIQPGVGDKLSVSGIEYRIERRTYDPLNAVVSFDCMAVK